MDATEELVGEKDLGKGWFAPVFALCLIMVAYLGLVFFGRLRLVSAFDTNFSAPSVLDVGSKGQFLNGAVIEFKEKKVIALRQIEDKQSYIHVGCVIGDKVFNLKKMDLKSDFAEDPRLFIYNDQLVVIYNDLIDDCRRMHLAFLGALEDGFFVKRICKLEKNGSMRKTEKNWVPFVHAGELYFIYQSSPWTVLKFHDSGMCDIVSETSILIPGETPILSGGTPAIEQNGEFLSFFHIRSGATRSYLSWNRYIYLVGAYTFEGTYPFRLKKITIKPITYKGAYNLFNNPKKILYPVGLVDKGSCYEVSLGVNDARTEVVTIAKEELDSLLSPLN
jgi:hypothetical protein